jgi:hypothetical protein
LFRQPEGKRPCGRPRRKWKNNIKRFLNMMIACGLDTFGSG